MVAKLSLVAVLSWLACADKSGSYAGQACQADFEESSLLAHRASAIRHDQDKCPATGAKQDVTRAVDVFTGLLVSGPLEVKFEVSMATSGVVHIGNIDKGLVDFLDIRVLEDGVLSIALHGDALSCIFDDDDEIEVYVKGQEMVNSISVSNSAEFELQNSSEKVQTLQEVVTMNATATSNGEIKLASISAIKSTIDVSLAGKVDLASSRIKTMVIAAKSDGNVSAWSVEELFVTAESNASIHANVSGNVSGAVVADAKLAVVGGANCSKVTVVAGGSADCK